MPAKSAIFEKKLQELRNSFREQLPARIDEIKLLVNLLASDSYDNATITQLHGNLHSLTGAGGTFGYSALSKQTNKLEEILLPYTEESVLDDKLIQSIVQLANEIDALSKQDPDKTKETYDKKPSRAVINNEADTSKSKCVYIVDDDYELAHDLMTKLEQFDYEIECFTDADSAITAAENNKPIAMLVDVMLSEGALYGPELVKRINDISIPIIFMSTRKDWQARIACVRSGGSAYLPKPIKINEVVEKLDLLTNVEAEEPFRIIIVDDIEVLAQHYAAVLGQAGMITTVVCDATKLLGILEKNKPDLILMDLYMPECTGIEVATILRQIDDYLDIPIVFLSTENNLIQKMTALKMGGDDFLQKPINDDYLVESISQRTRRFRLLRTAMERDGLTRLINRIGLDLELEREISRAEREGSSVIFAMLDVDNFKSVNDKYGHQTGDSVLKTMARLLSQRMRKSDIIGRYGGEEFGIILPNTDAEQAVTILNELRDSFSQISHTRFSGSFKVTFSAGIAAYPVYQQPKLLIQAADKALYKAKESGRNCVVCDAASQTIL